MPEQALSAVGSELYATKPHRALGNPAAAPGLAALRAAGVAASPQKHAGDAFRPWCSCLHRIAALRPRANMLPTASADPGACC